jgi:hypothetical protein
MNKIKLYTEEQVHNTVIAISNYLDDINLDRAQEKIEKHLKALQPIQLPSDEEAANASNHCKDGQVKVGFLRGVLWYQEQILNQNK